jgi:hypothetical protein
MAKAVIVIILVVLAIAFGSVLDSHFEVGGKSLFIISTCLPVQIPDPLPP